MTARLVTNPTLENVRAASRRGTAYVRLPHGDVRCCVRQHRNRILIEFRSDTIAYDLSPDAQERFLAEHRAYVQRLALRDRRGGVSTRVGKTTLVFEVLPEDAEEWFEKAHATLCDDSNLVPVTLD